jgi:UDP-N-acetylglucosamine/UDP-N-acetylgalactosamine diphosphorylase
MAGGTSRKDHSEVGSSYIHFNFTPEGDKTTASLIGDVPRGVMLNKPPIFLGGQGGMVGPLRMSYGSVVAAGSILREDVGMEKQLIVSKSPSGKVVDLIPRAYPSLYRVVENNIIYIANLIALEQWYLHVRKMFFEHQEFGHLIFAAILENLQIAKEERVKRLKDMAAKMVLSPDQAKGSAKKISAKREFYEKGKFLEEMFVSDAARTAGEEKRDLFLNALVKHREEHGGNYIEVIQSLPADISKRGTQWLDAIVDLICGQAGKALPALNMFKKYRPNLT